MACKDCITGTLHSGTPTGTIETIHGLPTYVANPSGASSDGSPVEAQATLVIIPDAFGWDFNNNRILADSYAAKGPFRVLLPDFMGGASLSPDVLKLMDYITTKHASFGAHTFWKGVYSLNAVWIAAPWILRCRWSRTHPGIVAWLRKLRDETSGTGSHKIGAAGFCWGGKHVFMLLTGDAKTDGGQALVDVGFTAHPSYLKLPDDAKKVKLPLSVAIGTEDIQITKEKIPALQSGLKESGAEHEVKVYQDATHGFAVRANPAVPKENDQGLEAEDQAISWFSKYLL